MVHHILTYDNLYITHHMHMSYIYRLSEFISG